MRQVWFENLRIPVRILLLVAPALAATICVAGLFAVNMRRDATALERAADIAAASTDITALVHELQNEQVLTLLSIADRGAAPRDLAPQRRATTTTLKQFQARSETIETEPGSRLGLVRSYARSQLMRLPGVRYRADDGTVKVNEVTAVYGGAIGSLLAVLLEQGGEMQSPAISRSALAHYDFMMAIEAAGMESAVGALGFGARRFTPELHERFFRLKDEQDGALRLFATFAADSERAILSAALTDPANEAIDPLRRLARDGGLRGAMQGVGGTVWWDGAGRRLDRLHTAAAELARHIEEQARVEARRARVWFVAWLCGSVIAVAGLAGLAVATGRSLSRPLHRITRTMTALAGGDLRVELSDQRRRDEIGAMARAVEVFRNDAVVRHQREAQIAHMTRHDLLTGLPNRATFCEKVEHALALAGRGGVAAIMCLELEGLKETADTLGDAACDRLVCGVAQRLQTCLRETDAVARFGAGEFGAVQIDLARPDDAAGLARRLLDVVGAPLPLDTAVAMPRISIGIALCPLDGTDSARLLRNADAALQQAKADGGNTYRFFEPDMQRRLETRRQIEADLVRAFAEGGLELLYQPFAETATGAIRGFEALVRLRRATGEQISPVDFIPVAEETGLILQLGEWVLTRACRDAMTWPVAVPVAVNLSVIQFRDPELADKVAATLAATGLPASRLELEITESVFLRDDERTLAVLHRLRDMGIRIAMDDFGTGFSSLGYLRSFPFDKIKIDRSFVRELGTRDGADAIVRAIVTLGMSLGMTVIAEGVETADQQERLRVEGCALVQGYLFGRPAPSTEAIAKLNRQAAACQPNPARGTAAALVR